MQDQIRTNETPLFSFQLGHMGALIQWSAQKPGNTWKYMPTATESSAVLVGWEGLARIYVVMETWTTPN